VQAVHWYSAAGTGAAGGNAARATARPERRSSKADCPASSLDQAPLFHDAYRHNSNGIMIGVTSLRKQNGTLTLLTSRLVSVNTRLGDVPLLPQQEAGT
jgi:hypothetical protein